jgi:phage terminase large subunit GpA-like protein
MAYNNLGQLVCSVADVVRPPERLTVSEAAEKYRQLNNPGSYVGPWRNSIVPYLVEPMDAMTSRSFNSVVFAGPAQCGKALSLDTPIATPTGWTTMGALTAGDMVFDERGAPCRVTFATEVMYGRECFAVEFDDGAQIVADAEHLWSVDDDHRPGAPRVMTTQEISATLKYGAKQRNRYAIPTCGPLQTAEVELPVEPYTLGVWLGDGHSLGLRVYGAPHDLAEIERGVIADGYETSTRVDGKGLGVMTVDKSNTNRTGRAGGAGKGLLGALHRADLIKTSGGQKHIPPAYLRASPEQRVSLLQGLMDTDGTVAKNGVCSFTTTQRSLAMQVRELAVSLGLKARVRERQTSCKYKGVDTPGKPSWNVVFIAYDTQPVFKLPRKKERQPPLEANRPGQVRRRRIIAIRPVESVPVRCITVDSPNHLYLAGETMIPTHNTELFLNYATYGVVCDPMDMILYQTSNFSARDFSRRRVDRLHRHTEEVGKRLMPNKDADNVFDKHYRSGMMLTLSWPSINELSGRPIGRVFLTDYDRMPMNVDGEGSPFDLGRKRTTTFGTSSMTVAESSPGFTVEDPHWIRRSQHEAPPTQGILALYNRGDRRRWFWPCLHCSKWFEPSFELLKWPDVPDVMEAAERAAMMCPHCAALIDANEKPRINKLGRWLKDGQTINEHGDIMGEGIRSDIASFWLKGPAAAFATWKDLVSRYILAEQEWQRTGSQEALKSTVNTDQGEAFYSRGNERERSPDELKSLASAVAEREVPADVRFLIATADVQKNMWVCQVFGISPSPDAPFKVQVIDRFDIRKSNRIDADGDTLWVKPGAFLEDWDLVTEKLLGARYPMADGSGTLGVAFIGCDSGGRAGVTANAYEWFRRLRKFGDGAHNRIHLIKGEGNPTAPRTRVGHPDAQQKGKKAIARGDVPVLFLNSNLLKDELNNMLERPGEDGQFVFPDWLPDEWFKEMCSERKTPKGWENPVHSRNEAWDLAYYCLGICRHRKVDRLNWNEPPDWAAAVGTTESRNPHFSMGLAVNESVAPKESVPYNTLADLAGQLA